MVYRISGQGPKLYILKNPSLSKDISIISEFICICQLTIAVAIVLANSSDYFESALIPQPLMDPLFKMIEFNFHFVLIPQISRQCIRRIHAPVLAAGASKRNHQ